MKARLITTRDLADYFNVSTNTIRRMSQRGELPKPITLSPGVVRWDLNAIDRLLDAKSGVSGQYVDPDDALRDLQ
jgi:predicted DNA-binding transcriptional regulator AlpA